MDLVRGFRKKEFIAQLSPNGLGLLEKRRKKNLTWDLVVFQSKENITSNKTKRKGKKPDKKYQILPSYWFWDLCCHILLSFNHCWCPVTVPFLCLYSFQGYLSSLTYLWASYSLLLPKGCFNHSFLLNVSQSTKDTVPTVDHVTPLCSSRVGL